jgi:hypothetical protein
MAICNIIEDTNRTDEQHQLINKQVQSSGPVPPEGCRLVVLGREWAITVWDSARDRDRFLAERLAPAYNSVGCSLDEATRTQFEVEMLVSGDLAGIVR